MIHTLQSHKLVVCIGDLQEKGRRMIFYSGKNVNMPEMIKYEDMRQCWDRK